MIRGRKRKIEKNENITRINPTVNASIHNRFDIEVVDAKTGEVKQKAYAENVILDNWWTALTETDYDQYRTHTGGPATGIVFGSGSGTPSSSDTDLFARFGYAASTDSGTWGAPSKSCYSMTKKVSLSETQYVGSVFTEIGLCSSYIPYSNGNPYFRKTTTHAMLKDMNGNQISLTKTDTDILNVTATVFLHWKEDGYGDGSTKVSASAMKQWYTSGWSAHFLFRFLAGVEYKENLSSAAAYNIYPSVSKKTDNAVSCQLSDDGKSISIVGTRIPVGGSNRCAKYATICCSGKAEYAPFIIIEAGGEAIPRSQIKGETVATADGTKTEFSTKFPYAKNAKIYVNGVEQASGVSVTDGFTISESPGAYLVAVDENSELGNLIYSQFPPSGSSGTYAYWGSDTNLLIPSDHIVCYYNPNYKEIGWNKVVAEETTCSVYVKDGVGGDWVSTSKTITGEKKNYPFMKIKFGTWDFYYVSDIYVYTDDNTINNIHFDEPPAAGAIITADYFTETIAKDENHVFDLSLTIQLGEYTGE